MERIKQICVISQIRLKSTQIFIVAGSIVLTLLITILCIGFLIRYEVENEVTKVGNVEYWNDEVSLEQKFWYDAGIKELTVALSESSTVFRLPKNVLVLLANGADVNMLAAARFQNNKQAMTPSSMAWDRFPHLAHLINSCSRTDYCDPGTMATALFGGVHTNFKQTGLSTAVNFRNCSAAMDEEQYIQSVLRQAELADLRTGFVTTQRLTGPTGAALYAHVADSSWECDATMPKGFIAAGCKDVARQLVEDETGAKLNVILGGGRQLFNTRVPKPDWDPLDESICRPTDGRNLVRDWQRKKVLAKVKFDLIQQSSELERLNGSSLDYLMGIFANGNLHRASKAPNLVKLLNKTLEVLVRPEKGYLLLAEQYFDKDLTQKQQLAALQEFNQVVETTMKHPQFISSETLVLVVFTKGHYISYGLDTSDETEVITDFLDIIDNDSVLEKRLNDIVGDTLVFASGPKSLLFQGTHDETYLAMAISYALQMGVFQRK